MQVAVIGLGYVGLPVAQRACDVGMTVTGFDLDTRVIANLIAGASHVDDVSDAALRAMLDGGFNPTSDESHLADCDVYIVCVPTPLGSNREPDLSAVQAAAQSIAAHLGTGSLVVIESTTYPGTTEGVVRPILQTSELTAGIDFHLAYSPERVDPGNRGFGLKTTPKIVGGLTSACRDAAVNFYSELVDSVVVTRGLREAEMAKLLENTYRHVNIAMVNEMAKFCHVAGIDLWDAIDAASTKPFGFERFTPGPGVGGHCIPIDPGYLDHFVRQTTGDPVLFIELAQQVNAGMPTYVVDRVESLLARDGIHISEATVTLLGVTYKADITDDRESPAHAVAEALIEREARVLTHDPLLPRWHPGGLNIVPTPDLATAVDSSDIVILLQAHRQFDVDYIAKRARRMLDTRGVTSRGLPGVQRL